MDARWSESRGLVAAVAVTAVTALLAVMALARSAPLGDFAAHPAASSSACARAPAGSTERAAEAVVEAFVGCIAGASPDTTRFPARVEGWYQLAPRVRNARGRWEYAGFVWLDAPDAAPAAFELLLELRGNRWFVSSFSRAPGSAELDLSNVPT